MRYLVIAAFWRDAGHGADAVSDVAAAIRPFKAEGTRGAVNAFNSKDSQTPEMLRDLERFQFPELQS